MIFGYRISTVGPPTAFKASERPLVTTPLTADDLMFPFRQIRDITDAEAAMSIDALRAKYPYVRPAEV